MKLSLDDKVLGRYVVEASLADAAQWAAYKARHERLGHEVVLTVGDEAASGELGSSLDRTARVLAQVRHPGVVGLRDYGLLDERHPCLVTDYIPGETLRSRIEKEGALPWAEAVKITMSLASGLTALHTAGVLHGAVAPDYVVMGEGSPARVCFVNLLAVRPLQAAETQDALHHDSFPCPDARAYMAPELIRGMPVDARADVYAMAWMLCELVTRHGPRGVRNVDAAAEESESLVPPLIAPPELPALPPALVEILERSLSFEPAQRPENARVFNGALRGLRQGIRTPLPQGRADATDARAVLPGQVQPNRMGATRLRSLTSPGVQGRTPGTRLRSIPSDPGIHRLKSAPSSAVSQPIETVEGSTTGRPSTVRRPVTAPNLMRPRVGRRLQSTTGVGAARSQSLRGDDPSALERTRTRRRVPAESSVSVTRQPDAAVPAALRASGTHRVRAVFAVDLPAEVFSDGPSRRWLRSLTTGQGLGFRLGDQVWVGVIMAADDERAASRAAFCLKEAREHFAHHTCRVAWLAVDEGFRLTTAAMRGKTPPPFALLELLEQVAGA